MVRRRLAKRKSSAEDEALKRRVGDDAESYVPDDAEELFAAVWAAAQSHHGQPDTRRLHSPDVQLPHVAGVVGYDIQPAAVSGTEGYIGADGDATGISAIGEPVYDESVAVAERERDGE